MAAFQECMDGKQTVVYYADQISGKQWKLPSILFGWDGVTNEHILLGYGTQKTALFQESVFVFINQADFFCMLIVMK